MKKEFNATKKRPLKNAFNKVSGAARFAGGVIMHTLNDFKTLKTGGKLREIGLALTLIIPIPGISLPYVAYRVVRYRNKLKADAAPPSNDNAPQNPPAVKKAPHAQQAKSLSPKI